jgi:hypothetical protein
MHLMRVDIFIVLRLVFCTHSRAPDATQLVLDKPFRPTQSQTHEKGQAVPT